MAGHLDNMLETQEIDSLRRCIGDKWRCSGGGGIQDLSKVFWRRMYTVTNTALVNMNPRAHGNGTR